MIGLILLAILILWSLLALWFGKMGMFKEDREILEWDKQRKNK